MTPLTSDYSRYFWQGEKTRLRPWRLEDAELRFMASLDSPTVALYQDGIELPTSVELQKQWLEKTAGLKDDDMIRFAMENLDGVTIGWVTLHSRDQKNGTFGFGVAVYRDYRGHGNAVDAVRTYSNMVSGNNATKNAIRCVYIPMKHRFGCIRNSGL